MGASTSSVTRIARQCVMGIAFTVSIIMTLANGLIVTFQSNRAIPAEEFPFAGWLYSVHPTIISLHRISASILIALCVWELIKVLKEAKGRVGHRVIAASWFVAIGGQILSFFHDAGGLVTAAGLYLVFFVDAHRNLAKHGSRGIEKAVALLDTITPQLLWQKAPAMAGLLFASFATCVAMESIFYTAPHAGLYFPESAFWAHEWVALASALISACRSTFELGILLLLMQRLIRPADIPLQQDLLRLMGWIIPSYFILAPASWHLLELISLSVFASLLRIWWRNDANRAGRIFVLPLMLAFFVWIRTKDIFFGTFYDEVTALGIQWAAHTFLGLCPILFAVLTHMGLSSLLKRHEPTRLRHLLCAATFCLVCPFAGLLGRKDTEGLQGLLRRSLPWSLLCVGVFLLVLLEVNYPQFTDFSQYFSMLLSMLISYVAFVALLLLYGAFSTPRTFVGAHIILIASLFTAFAVQFILGSMQVPRMVADQHSKLTRAINESAKIIPEAPHIGLGEDDAPPGKIVLKRMEDLPRNAPSIYEKRRPPIFFIVWDAARPDRTSAYGYTRKTTPNLEQLASDGTLFLNAYSSATATTTSMRHLFSGKFSSRYMLGVDHAPYLTGPLYELGYDFFLLNIMGSDFNGVSRESFLRNQSRRDDIESAVYEFGHYDEVEKTEYALSRLEEELGKRQDREHPGDGFFVFLHCTATHVPWMTYDDHPLYGDEEEDSYDNGMGHQDYALGILMERLKKHGLYDDAIIMVTADHGTGLKDHGVYGGFEPYEEQIRVPLIIKAPGFPAGLHVETPTVGMDLVPTLISFFRPGTPSPYDGFSLMDLMAGKRDHLNRRYLLSLNAFRDSMAMLDLETGYKLHLQRKGRYEMLYHLPTDPKELKNLADAQPKQVERMLRTLAPILWHRRHGYGNPFHYRPLEMPNWLHF